MSAYCNGISYFNEAANSFPIVCPIIRFSFFFFWSVAEHHERDERLLVLIQVGSQRTDPSDEYSTSSSNDRT